MPKLTSHKLCDIHPNVISHGEIDALKSLVITLPFNPVVVQIGAEFGISTLAMLEERPFLWVVSIDIEPCKEEFDNLKKAGVAPDRVIRVLGESQIVGKSWPFLVDMVFVDGDHSESGVRGDIDAWMKCIKPGGIIAFHDYVVEPIPSHIRSRVSYAVDDVMRGYKELLWTESLKAFTVA